MSSSLDAFVRIWTQRRTASGAVYGVAADSLAEDVKVAVAVAEQRFRYLGWQRRKRLLAWAVPGVQRRLASGRRIRLVTLPYPRSSMAQLAHAWLVLRHRIERRTGELEFCGTRAIGSRTGVPHCHVLADWGPEWLAQEWFSMSWREITGFSVVDVRQVSSVGAARYVAANVAGYVSDQAGGRMFRSRGWLPRLPDGS
jgi:hypothetical protein